MTENQKTLSASQVLLFSRCPYALTLRNEVKEETQTMLSGSLFHRLVELRFKGYTKEEAIGIAVQEFANQTHFPEAMKTLYSFILHTKKRLRRYLMKVS